MTASKKERQTPSTKESQPAEPNVGENLRVLRLERGLTLTELAERSGVSKAMLNQIESGKSSPTIALGWKIANGLGVPFGTLLGDSEPGDFVLHRDADITTFYSENRSLCSRALFPPGDNRAAEMYELTLAPGGEEQANPHAVGTREQIYVTSGQFVIETAGRRAQLEAGDLIFFRADRNHRYFNPGKKPARGILIMRYPPGHDPQHTESHQPSRRTGKNPTRP
jgi:transcriptional regulator with XRE-family HTH domain